MGTPISLDDPEYGDDCEPCFDPGKTPKYIYAWFWDILKGDQPGALQPPNLHLFKLEQDEGDPCVWLYENAAFGWWVKFWFSPNVLWELELFDFGNNRYFNGVQVPCPQEHDKLDNLYVAPANNWGYNGHGIIQWLVTAASLISSFVLPTDSDILFEFFTTEAGLPVYKYCFPKYSMNVKFLLNP